MMNLKNKISNNAKLIEILLHVLFWIFLFSSLNVEWTQNWFDKSLRPKSLAPLSVLFFGFAFYVNSFWLVPKFLKSNWKLYIIGAIGLFILPELIRSTIITISSNSSLELFSNELFSRDSFLFGPISPAYLALIASFIYWGVKELFSYRLKMEQLETLKFKTEIDQLKSQLNPHFLFNNLNALDYLIEDKNEAAKEYLHALANVYRSFLNNSNENLVSLQDEWNLIDDYLKLIKIRYATAYEFQKNSQIKNLNDFVIPPGTLQGLIENVVKHNQGDINNPLICKINVDISNITISNPIKSKSNFTSKSGSGIENIRKRILLLTNKEVQIIKNEHFKIILPLIKKSDIK